MLERQALLKHLDHCRLLIAKWQIEDDKETASVELIERTGETIWPYPLPAEAIE
ncbi:MAG: hypothetical protein IPP67_04745 [Rhodospirillaceae bacterium]|nr:hypothetical protein [Rhodospirillaceae bacterium]